MHCPQKIPDRKNAKILWDEYPGIQSILTPADGIAHEWITSREEAKIWIRISLGKAIAPLPCNRIKLVKPRFICLYWFFSK